jgi:hypothetical protein
MSATPQEDELTAILNKQYMCGIMPRGLEDEEEIYASLSDILNDNYEPGAVKSILSSLRQAIKRAELEGRIAEAGMALALVGGKYEVRERLRNRINMLEAGLKTLKGGKDD